MVRFLTEAIVLAIHEDQVRLYGGVYGVRDAAALDTALHMPQTLAVIGSTPLLTAWLH